MSSSNASKTSYTIIALCGVVLGVVFGLEAKSYAAILCWDVLVWLVMPLVAVRLALARPGSAFPRGWMGASLVLMVAIVIAVTVPVIGAAQEMQTKNAGYQLRHSIVQFESVHKRYPFTLNELPMGAGSDTAMGCIVGRRFNYEIVAGLPVLTFCGCLGRAWILELRADWREMD